MPCKNCLNKPVIKLTNNNIQLCKQHFIKYFERKVMHTIGKYKLLDKEDNVGVALSGGKDSVYTGYLAKKYNLPFRQLKFQAMGFTKGKSNAKELREEIFKIKNLKDLREFIENNNF